MESLEMQRPQGLSTRALRIWALFFAAAGIIGRCVLQNGILGIHGMSAQELQELMSESKLNMILITASLVMQAMETCAIPIFLFLLVEGVRHTRSIGRYFLRVLGLAFLTEIPYNLAMSGTWLDPATRNPVFAMAVSLALMYFFRRYQERSPIHFMVKLLVCTAAVLWVGFLGVEYGLPILFLALVLWAIAPYPRLRILVGALASVLCCLFSLFFMASAMSFLILHFYQGEKGEGSTVANYLAYPALLLAAALGALLFV